MEEEQYQQIQLRLLDLSVEIEECVGYPNVGYSSKGNQLYDLIQESKRLLKKLPIIKEKD